MVSKKQKNLDDHEHKDLKLRFEKILSNIAVRIDLSEWRKDRDVKGKV